VLEQLQSKPYLSYKFIELLFVSERWATLTALIRLNNSLIKYFNNLNFGSPFEGVLNDNLWQRIDFSASNKPNKNQIKLL